MTDIQPPRFFHRFFRWFCHPDYYEELAGDLAERFYKDQEEKGSAYAKKQYRKEVLKLFRPSVFKNFSLHSILPDMLRHYFKVSIRNLLKNRESSIINILGLTIGLSGCLLIGLFVNDELQFDKHHPNSDRLYRVYAESFGVGGEAIMATTSPRIGTAFKEDFPEITETLRMFQTRQKFLFKRGDQGYMEEGGFFAEPLVFDLFDLPLLYGDAAAALAEPDAVVLSAGLAKKYFGEENPVGQELTINAKPAKVTGVLKELSPHFHLDFKFLFSFETLLRMVSEERIRDWIWQDFINYVQVHPQTDLAALETKIDEYAEKNIHPKTQKLNFYYNPRLQKVEDIHLYSANFRNDVAVRSNHIYVKGLVGVGLFLLLIACINFINLATARAVQRAKEVGVRKTSGALRGQLALQFIGEAIIVVFIAALLALLLGNILLPFLNDFTGKSISFHWYSNPTFLSISLSAILLAGLLAGAYPSFVLSGFRPIDALKAASFSPSNHVHWFRKGLVILQFSLSILLIISLLIISQQISHLSKKDMGFQKDQLLHFPMRGKLFKNPEIAKAEFLKIPEVQSVTACFGIPGDIVSGDNIIVPGEDRQTLSARIFNVDHDYIPTMGMEILAGRNFSKAIPTDANRGFIVNETAIRALNLGDNPEEALNKPLEWPMWNEQDSIKKGMVIGVVKDFHYASLHESVQTAVLQIYPQSYWKMAVRVKSDDLGQTLAALENSWDTFDTGYPFDYQFVDAGFGAMYKKERNWRTLIWIAAGLAIFIASIGAFGLAAYAAEQRRKEIGIRKILGASTAGIIGLLSKDFLQLIIVALLLASPLAWYLMDNWLDSFAYRIKIQWWVFPLAGFSAILIALLTIGGQSLKAATSNPINSLRDE